MGGERREEDCNLNFSESAGGSRTHCQISIKSWRSRSLLLGSLGGGLLGGLLGGGLLGSLLGGGLLGGLLGDLLGGSLGGGFLSGGGSGTGHCKVLLKVI